MEPTTHIHQVMHHRHLKGHQSPEAAAVYEQLDDAYKVHAGVYTGSGTTQLAVLRQEYSKLLEKVKDLDRALLGRSGHQPLAPKLLPQGSPGIDSLKFPLDWKLYEHPTKTDEYGKKPTVAAFAPPGTQNRLIVGGWTNDKFVKLMFQIPEMQLYVDTKGYTDFSKFNRQETLGSLSRSLSRSMSAEREFSAADQSGTPSLDPITEDVRTRNRSFKLCRGLNRSMNR